MLQLEELKQTLLAQQPKIQDLREALGCDRLLEEKKKLDEEAASPDFWNDMENTRRVLKEQKVVNEKLDSYNSLVSMFEDAQTMVELASEEEFGSEEEQEAFLRDIRDNLKEIDARIEEEKLSALLSGEFDSNNAILTFHAGAGGTEAQDWVQMLYRMYARWSERHHFKVKVLDYLAGEEAGIKSASILITGTNAYGFLKSENGVHRLVRISPFDASGRRQTSFASLEVMPEIDDDYDIEINPADLKIDTYRSGGAGGQHVNKTESAIRITHIPTGVIVACQNERSQHQNREVAMKMLKSKLVKIKEREHLKRIEDIKGEQQQIGWGSQIRSYVFMPYTLVKDHRTGYETGNINAVMDGEIDPFINAYLKAASQGENLTKEEDGDDGGLPGAPRTAGLSGLSGGPGAGAAEREGPRGQRAAGGLSAGEGDRANLFQPLPAGGADAGAAGPAAGFAH